MTVSERATTVPGCVPPRSTGSDFVAFYEHEFTQAARFAWLLVRTSAVAEDLAQEAFVSLYRGFEQIDNPRGFVHRAIVNQARAWQRNERRRAQGGPPETGIRHSHAGRCRSLRPCRDPALSPPRCDRRPLLGWLVGGGDRPDPRVPARDGEVPGFTSTHPIATGGKTVTEPVEDFEARLTRVLKAGAAELSVGQTVPPFASPHALASRIGPRRRTVRRKVAIVGVALGLALTGTAAAATIVHLTSAPVTETDLARCYTVDSLAGGNNFRGSSVTAAGPIGSNAQVTNALSACTLLWQDGLLTPAPQTWCAIDTQPACAPQS